MSRTFGALLAERRAALVGRDAELAALATLLDDDGPLVAVVHGVAGSGKSALLRAFGAEAAERGAAVVTVDGRAVEPTPQGFLAAVERSLGRRRSPPSTARSSSWSTPPSGCGCSTAGCASRSCPRCPSNARVVLATRDAPGAVWRSSFGELLRTVPLGPLSPADAAEVLRLAGLDETQAEWVNRFVRGHPLSLQLAASAIRERPDAPEDAVLPTVVQELAALYLDGLDPATREALDATSVLRRVTLSLLGALLPGEPPQAPFARLAALPFVELGREGLVVHDTVREAVAALLRASDPVRHRAYRGAAWRQIRQELAGTAGAARWPSLADMIALVDEPLVREAFFPSSVQHYAVEAARPDDRAAIEAIVERHAPPEQLALVRAWWDELPAAFRVARSPRGVVVAFTILCELAEVPQRLLMRDALCDPARRHLRAQPVPRGQRILFVRLALAHGTGVASSPCFASLLRDIERASLEAGPALRRIYTHAHDDGLFEQLAPVGFGALPDCSRRRARRRGVPADRVRPGTRFGRRLAVRARRSRPARGSHRPRRGRARARARRPARRAHQARVRRAGLPARARAPARRARGAPARRVGLRVDRRLQRRRGRRVGAAAQARRPRGRAGDGARRRLPAAAALRRAAMRLPSSAHSSRPWRIHELTRDFRLEDVWALPTPGGPDDFPRLMR